MKIEELKEEIKNISEPKVSSKSVPFLSQLFLKKVSEKSPKSLTVKTLF